MPAFTSNEVTIHYEVSGDGFPVLLFAPGGMRSAIAFWSGGQWNPVEALSPHFQVIAMDQRNAGQSVAPITADDGWHSYTTDHLNLLDHLGIDSCHLLGGCIGVMQADPGRVASAVLQQTIGLDNNRQAFYDMFDSWAEKLREDRPGISDADLRQFRSNMYDGDFVFNVDQEFIRGCRIPMLVLMGNDLYHPQSTSREIASLAPDATLVENWKEPDVIDRTVETVIAFLKAHTPGTGK